MRIGFPLRLRSADCAQARLPLDHPAAMRYYLIIMARLKKTPLTEPLKVCSLKVTPTAEHLLQRLSQDASDALGWTVSNSAVLRALLAYVAQQPSSWASSTLYPFVEQEIACGRVWGRKKKRE